MFMCCVGVKVCVGGGSQAQLREKQRVEELERMKEGIKQLVEDAAIRTRKEVCIPQCTCFPDAKCVRVCVISVFVCDYYVAGGLCASAV